MRGEPFVEHREVRRDNVARGQIAAQKFGEEQPGFCQRGFGEQIVQVVVGIQIAVGRGGHNLPKIEPVIEEGIHKLP